jgi:hypothetical protein
MRGFILSLTALSFLAGPVAAQDIPARKPGLWQISMNFEGRGAPPQTMKQCIDAQTDKMMNRPGGGMSGGREQCSKQDVQRAGNTIVVDSVCKVGAMTNTSHAVMSGDFNSAYTVQVDSKQEGGPGAGAMRMTMQAKWLGPCEAGQKPGDMIMANGMSINIRDMQQMQGGGMPPGGMQGMPGRPGMPAR